SPADRYPLFFVPWHGDHQVLHSFPTRRSSDLTRGRRDWLHASFLPTGFTAASPAPRHASGSPGGIMRVAELMHSDLRTISSATLDRKSTRLNSSHVAISYAVLSLKKNIPAPYA